MEHALDGLVGAIIGALFGGWAVLRSAKKQHENDKRLANLERQRRIDGVLQAIYYEIKILGEVYDDAAGKVLATIPDGGECRVQFSLTQDYFIVYPANCEVIGQIDDDEKLVEVIINTYNIANFLIEIYRINTLLLENQIKIQTKITDNMPVTQSHAMWQAKVNQYSQYLRDSARDLKKYDAKLKGLSADLLSKIDAYRKKHGHLKA